MIPKPCGAATPVSLETLGPPGRPCTSPEGPAGLVGFLLPALGGSTVLRESPKCPAPGRQASASLPVLKNRLVSSPSHVQKTQQVSGRCTPAACCTLSQSFSTNPDRTEPQPKETPRRQCICSSFSSLWPVKSKDSLTHPAAPTHLARFVSLWHLDPMGPPLTGRGSRSLRAVGAVPIP